MNSWEDDYDDEDNEIRLFARGMFCPLLNMQDEDGINKYEHFFGVDRWLYIKGYTSPVHISKDKYEVGVDYEQDDE